MKPYKPSSKGSPERKIQNLTIQRLSALGWYVRHLPGSCGNVGWPDLFACHYQYGYRWIEIKNTKNYRFTDAQLKWFPQYRLFGWKVWFLQDHRQTDILFKKPNWGVFDKFVRTTKAVPVDFYEAAISGTTPEATLQRQVVRTLTEKGWLCRHIIGNVIRTGWPDLYVYHPVYGGKWIELKRGDDWKFTGAQLEQFPKFYAHRCGIWFITSTKELDLLEGPPNWDVMFSRIVPNDRNL